MIAALLGGAAYSFNGTSPSGAIQQVSSTQEVQDSDAANAATKFIRSMSAGDEKTVWLYASEEEQEAFATEADTYAAFAEAFPALTNIEDIAVTETWQEGDTPFIAASLTDDSGQAYRAKIGLWLDDAGDWKVVSCDVEAATAQVASR
jgi:capsule polysaccharide modification protein KpsS